MVIFYSLIKTIFYSSFFTFLLFLAAEIARPGFVSYFFHLPLFFVISLLSGVYIVIVSQKD